MTAALQLMSKPPRILMTKRTAARTQDGPRIAVDLVQTGRSRERTNGRMKMASVARILADVETRMTKDASEADAAIERTRTKATKMVRISVAAGTGSAMTMVRAREIGIVTVTATEIVTETGIAVIVTDTIETETEIVMVVIEAETEGIGIGRNHTLRNQQMR